MATTLSEIMCELPTQTLQDIARGAVRELEDTPWQLSALEGILDAEPAGVLLSIESEVIGTAELTESFLLSAESSKQIEIISNALNDWEKAELLKALINELF